MRVHYQRLTADCPVPSSASPSAKHEKKKAGPGTYNPPENNFVVGVGPENKDIMGIAVSKCGEDGIDGNLCKKRHASFKAIESEILQRFWGI